MKRTIKATIIAIIVVGASIGVFFLIITLLKIERVEFDINDATIDDFAYWIQDIDKDSVKNSKYDLIIIDYSADGSDAEEFAKDDVSYMKSSGEQEKLLVSYISVGEAENYRFYWNEMWDENGDGTPDAGAPGWLEEENPDWEGNYKVKYWNPGWQDIVFEYLDCIMSAEFDGIYMDIVDAYEYYEDSIEHSDWLMIDFVCNISNYVKNNEEDDFLVFAPNGDELLKNSTYLNHIDGIGREDLFYNDDEETDDEWRDDAIDNLNKALDADKVVLVIDYPILDNNIYDFYKMCVENGYLPYAAERELDGLKQYWFYPAT